MTTLTPKAITALRLLEGTSRHNTRSGKALATMLWPEKLKECGTSLRRGGLYRAAGAYYSKLQKKGLVAHWIDDFESGYYITAAGVAALISNVEVTGAARLYRAASGGMMGWTKPLRGGIACCGTTNYSAPSSPQSRGDDSAIFREDKPV